MPDHLGRAVAVTGAGSGNGKEIAQTILEEGASIALLDIAPDFLTEIDAQYPRAPRNRGRRG